MNFIPSQRLTLLFTCAACGLVTPGIVNLPAVRRTRKVIVEQECHHCDGVIERSFRTAQQLIAAAEPEVSVKR